MSINRRHMLTGLAVAVPTTAISSNAATAIASNADAAKSDAELFRLEAEFNEACVLWEATSESVDAVEWKNQSVECGGGRGGPAMRGRLCPRPSHHGHARTYAGRNPAEVARRTRMVDG